MKLIPLFKCRDLKAAINFYTVVLDFELKYPDEIDHNWGADLINDNIELQLTVLENPTLFGSIANIWVDDVDSLFAKYQSRGLDQSHKIKSPVHLGPTDQTWGTREFYITDADGNTLRFCQEI